MTAYFFGFAKKENSTKQPNLQDGTNLAIQLKEETDVSTAVFIIN